MLILFTFICGGIYPAAVTDLAVNLELDSHRTVSPLLPGKSGQYVPNLDGFLMTFPSVLSPS
jgi:hypothetical protein